MVFIASQPTNQLAIQATSQPSRHPDVLHRSPGACWPKAIGDIYDDTHISTASEGTFCAIYFEGEDQTLRETFISSILDSNAQRFIWISTFDIDKDVEKLANLVFVKYQKDSNYNNLILSLEEAEEIDEKYIELKL